MYVIQQLACKCGAYLWGSEAVQLPGDNELYAPCTSTSGQGKYRDTHPGCLAPLPPLPLTGQDRTRAASQRRVLSHISYSVGWRQCPRPWLPSLHLATKPLLAAGPLAWLGLNSPRSPVPFSASVASRSREEKRPIAYASRKQYLVSKMYVDCTLRVRSTVPTLLLQMYCQIDSAPANARKPPHPVLASSPLRPKHAGTGHWDWRCCPRTQPGPRQGKENSVPEGRESPRWAKLG